MSTQLSPRFTLEEIERNATAKRIGDPNKIPESNLHIWIKGCQNLLEPIRIARGDRMYISCGYRSERVNSATNGSSSNSSHRGKSIINDVLVPACAFDIDLDPYQQSNLDFFHMVRQNFKGKFDQLIYEYGWVHIGYTEKPRGQVLVLVTEELREKYKIPKTKRYITYFEGMEL